MKYKLGIFLIPLLLLSACQEDPAPTGATLLPDINLVDVVQYDSFEAGGLSSTSTYFRANKGETATRLWLGEYAGYRSEVMMLWNNFSEAIGDEGTILETKIVLHTSNNSLGGDPGIIAFDVLEVTEEVAIADVTSETMASIQTKPTPAGTYSGMDTTITVQLDTAMVREWMRRFTKNINLPAESAGPEPYGIKIVPKAMSHVQGFHSGNGTTSAPELHMIVDRDGEIDTLRGVLLRDTYATWGPDLSAQPLTVHGGLSYRGRMKFDISAIPSGSIVNYVKLTMKRNPAGEQRTGLGIDSVLVFEALSESLDSISLSSSLCRATEENPDEYFVEGTINTATLILAVQRWVNSPELNRGLIVTKMSENTDLDQLNFYGADAEPDNRPRLQVFYTTKP